MITDPCPECGEQLEFDEVDVGVGVIRGNPGCPNCGWTPKRDKPHKADWARFLRERHLLIEEWVAEGQSFDEIARKLSMDPQQVQLISLTPVPQGDDRYGWS